MALDLTQQREETHGMIDRLRPEQLKAVRHLLRTMLDPLSQKLAAASSEDEEISEDEERTAADSREWLKHNRPIPNEDVLADFGLTNEDFERLARTPLTTEPNRPRD